MKRLDLLPFVLLAGLGGFIASAGSRASELELEAPIASPAVTADAGAHEAQVRAPSRADGVAALPFRDASDVRNRLALGQRGTYITEVLNGRDSSLARWRDRGAEPLRVWVQPHSDIPHWRPVFASYVRSAFDAWASAGIPMRFSYVVDSAAAEVHVHWIDRFEESISGRTHWARDGDWWILDGHITLAVHHNTGTPLDDEAIRAIALHEVGHLIGLDHTTDTTSIMTPRVRVRTLSDADRATARLLYSLPAGPVR